MNGKYIHIMTVILALGSSGFGSAFAGDTGGEPQAGAPAGEGSEATPPRAPLRLSTVDFEDTSAGAGKLTLAGVALPGHELYLFLDDEPLAKVVPDDGGKWSFEGGMTLSEGRHTLRADQYDQATDMLAARAMVTIQRTKPGETPPDVPAPGATAH